MCNFPRTAAAPAGADARAALAADLQALGLGLPLEKGCAAGGFPADPRVYNVVILETRDDQVRAAFSVAFTERAQPGCGGGAAEYHRRLACVLTVDRRTGAGRITVEEPDLPDEF